jgi:SAM-dependent methyltransferase
MADWISFFDSENPIYVNARHRDVHARLVADGIIKYLPSRNAVLLDYGCGEARYAERIAAEMGRLVLCEAAPHVRERLAARVAGNEKISVRAPSELADLPDASFDLIVMHSVAQYLTPQESDALFLQFRRLLRPDGCFVLGDIVRPQGSALADAMALLRLGAANGFFGAALLGLMRMLASDYWRLRQRAGLTRYGEAAMLQKLGRAGFSPQRAPDNIGHIQSRLTFIARPR